MDSLWRKVSSLQDELDDAELDSLAAGENWANSNAEYNSAKAKAVARMKSEGESATMIQLMVKGDPKVNRAMLQRDLDLVTYSAAKEHVNVLKKKLDTNREQLDREWHSR